MPQERARPYSSESRTHSDRSSERRAADRVEPCDPWTNPLRSRRMFRRETTALIHNTVRPNEVLFRHQDTRFGEITLLLTF